MDMKMPHHHWLKRNNRIWVMANKSVPGVLQRLVDVENKFIVVFMNAIDNFIDSPWFNSRKSQLAELAKKVGRPMLYILATKYDKHLKPGRGMWDYMVEHVLPEGALIDIENSFYCGVKVGEKR
jgi:DNA 3'-phosphatase